MSKYNTFLVFFIIATVSFVFFMVFYLQGFFSFAISMQGRDPANFSPFEMLGTIFTPPLIISGIILVITGLVYRVLGIVYVAKTKTVTDGEKALWIIGFAILGFITSIVFLALAKGRKLVE